MQRNKQITLRINPRYIFHFHLICYLGFSSREWKNDELFWENSNVAKAYSSPKWGLKVDFTYIQHCLYFTWHQVYQLPTSKRLYSVPNNHSKYSPEIKPCTTFNTCDYDRKYSSHLHYQHNTRTPGPLMMMMLLHASSSIISLIFRFYLLPFNHTIASLLSFEIERSHGFISGFLVFLWTLACPGSKTDSVFVGWCFKIFFDWPLKVMHCAFTFC